MQIPFLLITILFFTSCSANTEAPAINNDSIVNALNAADTIRNTQQKTTDSVNKAYLDSFRKHVADSNNAEYGSPH